MIPFPFNRQTARDHLVQHHSQRPDVGTPIGLLTQRLFGRHVGGSSQDRGRISELRAIGKLCQTKVHDLGLTLRGDHHVGTFDVAVDNAAFMSGLEALCGLGGDVKHLVEIQWSLGDLILDR